MELVGATQTCGSFWGRSITNTFRSGTKQTFKMQSLVRDVLLVMNCTIIFLKTDGTCHIVLKRVSVKRYDEIL